MQLAIIGTAGRKEDNTKINTELYNNMKDIIYKFVKERPQIDSMISGGAAVADHLAVLLYNKDVIKKLTLCLPCKFDMANCQFEDNKNSDWFLNPGKTVNYYHNLFCGHCNNLRSLKDIQTAINKGAKVIVKDGFHERNAIVAQADLLIAFTFGNESYVKPGGTAHTVSKFLKINKSENSYHVDLNTFKIYQGAKVFV